MDLDITFILPNNIPVSVTIDDTISGYEAIAELIANNKLKQNSSGYFLENKDGIYFDNYQTFRDNGIKEQATIEIGIQEEETKAYSPSVLEKLKILKTELLGLTPYYRCESGAFVFTEISFSPYYLRFNSKFNNGYVVGIDLKIELESVDINSIKLNTDLYTLLFFTTNNSFGGITCNNKCSDICSIYFKKTTKNTKVKETLISILNDIQ